ncbi:hypothetical protein PVAND_007927 [Polypedilum vanderplanki]|uniref:CHK kinase-like domain-containing protein n=1 Tax=Polypedilum vanderplanki TaxID=319348 RepID=A0A9J6C8X4_POLVA|nr:hypothetical protein PVAND_007927 [Polypedilum vanderplanki]
MYSSVPEWLNEKFFEKVLRTARGDKNLTISEVNVAASNKSREHYASTIFKATVKYVNKFDSNNVTKLLIKLVIPKANAFSDENSFDTEVNMYLNTLPDMERMLSQGGEKIELSPRLLFSSKEPEPVLVFEDATVNGYGISAGPLNLEGTKFVVTKLAKFHAASIYLDRDGQGVDYYKNGLFNLRSRDGINFMRNNMYLFIDEIKSWEGYELICTKMENVAKSFDELGRKVYEANNGDGFNVLNHGDFHFNNMLFKKNDEGKISDVLFIDYQMSKWGSPCIDLFYLIYLVASQETRENYRNEIIAFYYQELVKSLKQIGFMSKPPAMLDLNVELLKNGFLEVLIAVCFIPFMFMDQHSDDADVAFENGIEGVNLRKNLYKNENYREFIGKLLPVFLRKGLLG